MKKRRLLKGLCIVGGAICLAGGVLFGISALSADGDLKELSHLTTHTHTYAERAENPVQNIRISYQSETNVHVLFSDTATEVSVSYGSLHTKKGKAIGNVSVTDTNGNLEIVETRTKKDTVRSLSPFSTLVEITVDVVLPSDRTYALSVYTDNGDVRMQGALCQLTSLQLITDNGDVDMQRANVVCSDRVTVETDNGDVDFGNLTTRFLTVETDNGDVDFQGVVTASHIAVETDNGDVETDDRGYLDADMSVFEIDNGDLEVRLVGTSNDYAVLLDIENGKCNVPQQSTGERRLDVHVDNGDVYVTFVGTSTP